MIINKHEYESLKRKIIELEAKEKLYEEYKQKWEETMEAKAVRASEVLKKLGVKAESAKQIRETLAMEILSDEFEMQDKYSKAHFVRTQDGVMQEVRQMLLDEGVITRGKKIGGKK